MTKPVVEELSSACLKSSCLAHKEPSAATTAVTEGTSFTNVSTSASTVFKVLPLATTVDDAAIATSVQVAETSENTVRNSS